MQLILIVLLAILPPCETEDSPNCGYDAANRSNGVGHSFVDIGGTAYYLN